LKIFVVGKRSRDGDTSQEDPPMNPEEARAAADAFEAAYAAAFNRRDAHALAALFLEDATLVTEWGDVVEGRAAFEAGLARAFAALRDAPVGLVNRTSHVAQVAEGVLITHGTSVRSHPAEGRDYPLAFTRVLVRRAGEWRLAANHVSEPSVRPDFRAGAAT
jgi:uncharacterized protein (TIGR02246 family)